MENRTISIPAETRFPTECYRVFVLFLPSFLSAARQLELVPYRVVPSFFFFSFQSMDVVFSYEQAQVDSVYRVLPSFTEFFSVDFVERRPNKEPDVFCFCFFFLPDAMAGRISIRLRPRVSLGSTAPPTPPHLCRTPSSLPLLRVCPLKEFWRFSFVFFSFNFEMNFCVCVWKILRVRRGFLFLFPFFFSILFAVFL